MIITDNKKKWKKIIPYLNFVSKKKRTNLISIISNNNRKKWIQFLSHDNTDTKIFTCYYVNRTKREKEEKLVFFSLMVSFVSMISSSEEKLLNSSEREKPANIL